MRYVAALIGVMMACLAVVLIPHVAGALTTAPSDGVVIKTDSPLIITNYSFTASRLNYVQLYNNSSEVMALDGWQLQYDIAGQTINVPVTLNGMVEPAKYTIIANDTLHIATPFLYHADEPDAADVLIVTALHLVPPSSLPYLAHDATTPSLKSLTGPDMYITRNTSTSTGNYLSSLTASDTPPVVVFMDDLYEYPADTALQISEIVPNARNCAPTETALDCNDYVKFYNPTSADIDLAQFRLRNGYKGQAATASNTMQLTGLLEPGHYVVIPMDITSSASWVWLEDSYGLKQYDVTVTSYPDATSKKGQAWAYDTSDGSWKWTLQPAPADSPSVFPAPPPIDPQPSTSSLTPCKGGQYRSEETNRCRTIVTASSSLTPCAENQYRSEETNRCRNIVTASSSLAPCGDDETRNPDTNRCRKVATASASLAPCKEGQERNPDTNRCRNIAATSVPEAAFAVEPIKETGTAFVGWWALGGVGLLALGYAGWEWRQEVLTGIRKVGTFFHSRK